MKKLLFVIAIFIHINDGQSQVNLSQGLIACYPFSGNANDYSGSFHNGIVTGPVLTTDRFGISNSAYQFDGIQDFIDIGPFSTFTNSTSFSISVWIKPNQVKLQTILFLMPDNFNDRLNAMAYYSHNGISTTIWDYGNCTAGGRLLQLGTPFSNLWQHWVYTINPANGMRVYKNGNLYLNSSNSSAVINRQRYLWIGGGSDASGAPFYFDGKIDDMRLYDRELNAAEVQELYITEQICTPTALQAGLNTESPILVFVSGNKIKVRVKPGVDCGHFKLVNTEGKLLYELSTVKAGNEVEIEQNDNQKGLLLYSYSTSKGMKAGKLIYPLVR
jgi:Concanavalin A-like lectin/glucanases superfamily